MKKYFTIVKDNVKSLREKSIPVSQEQIDDAVLLANEMTQYLIDSQNPELSKKYNLREGVGLAAPQIGKNIRLLVVYFKEEVDGEQRIVDHRLINPKIISESVKLSYLAGGEGCLSVDDNHDGYIYRKYKILVRAIDAKDKTEKIITARGYEAIVLQHELDHLDGILYYDHIDKNDPFKVIEGSTRL